MKFINKFLLLILAITYMSGCSYAEDSRNLKFGLITDIHYLVNPVETNSKRDLTGIDKNLYFAVNSMTKQDIKFVVFLGDNIDKSQLTNLSGFLYEVKNLNKPYYLVLGNHDSYKVSGIKKEDYMAEVLKVNKNQKSKLPYYTFKINRDILGIVVDGATPFMPSKHGVFTKEQIMWLDKILTKNKDKIVLIFQHFPIIEPTDNESHKVLEPDNYIDLFIKHKNIAMIASGHYHAEKIQVDEYGITHISVPAFVNRPSCYEIVDLKYDKYKKGSTPKVKIKVEKIKI